MSDWFTENAPKKGDWFAENAPSPASAPNAEIKGPETIAEQARKYARLVAVHGPEMIGQLLGGITGTASSGPVGGIAGSALGGAAGRSATNLLRTAIPSVDEFARNSGMDPLPTSLEAGLDPLHASLESAKQVGTAAAIGGAGELAGQVGGKVLKSLAPSLKSAAETQMGKVLYPTKEKNKVIASRIAPEMLDRRMIVGSREALQDKAAAEAAALAPQVENTYASLPTDQVSEAKKAAIDSLDALKQRYAVAGDSANPNLAGKSISAKPEAVRMIERVQKVVENSDASPQNLRKVKQIFDEDVADAGGYASNDLTTKYTLKAERAAAGQIRDILHQKFPDTAELDKEIKFWLDLKGVMKATNLRLEGQQRIGPVMGGTLGAVEGYRREGESGAFKGALVGAAGGSFVLKALRSPLWMSVSAITKNEVADMLAKGQIDKAALIAGRAVGALAQSSTK